MNMNSPILPIASSLAALAIGCKPWTSPEASASAADAYAAETVVGSDVLIAADPTDAMDLTTDWNRVAKPPEDWTAEQSQSFCA